MLSLNHIRVCWAGICAVCVCVCVHLWLRQRSGPHAAMCYQRYDPRTREAVCWQHQWAALCLLVAAGWLHLDPCS